MKKTIFYCFFLISILLFQLLLSQEPTNLTLNGNGARAAGMGYAFTGIADDATAISWNPAGLTQLQSMEASVIGRLSIGTASIDFPSGELSYLFEYYNDYDDYGATFMDVNSWDIEKASKFKINFASFVFPFQMGENNIVGGIAYRNMVDLSQELTQTGKGEYWQLNIYNLTLTNFGDEELELFESNKGGINAISPAIGFQLNEMLSAGATLNFIMGKVETEYYREWKTYGLKVESDPYETEFSGTSIDLGILVKPNPQLSLGANLGLPYTLNIKEEEAEEMKLKVPFFYSLGAGFRATDNLLLAFDYRSRPWKKAEMEDVDENIFDYNANSIHVGLEYLMTSGESILPVRLGFYTEPLLLEDYNEDQIKNNVFTAGIGIIMGNIILDGAIEWAKTSFVWGETYGTNEEYDYSGNEFRISIGAVMHFPK
jgi:opacity protein-like surface antigen